MSSISIKLNAFEGPLDLLMHLIEKDKIDIYDIPIVDITEQYITYLKKLSEFDMELASEFLVMAATLLQIKSRMLLPKNELSDEDEADPRQMLVDMLIEYRKIKKVAALLQEMKSKADNYIARKPLFLGIYNQRIAQYTVGDLLDSYLKIDNSSSKNTAYIRPQAFSVQEKMTEILKKLHQVSNGFSLNDLLSSSIAGEKVAVFLGVLELLKLGVIKVSQSERFAPIYIFAKDGE